MSLERKVKIDFVTRIYKKKFQAESRKEAYLKACKWAATIVIANQDELCQIDFRYEFLKEQLPTCQLSIYLALDELEFRNTTCTACREYNRLFFMQGKSLQCEDCKMWWYINRMEEFASGRKTLYGGKLKRIIKEKGL